MRDKVLVGLLEELERVGDAFRSATEPIDTSTPKGAGRNRGRSGSVDYWTRLKGGA